MSCCGAVKDSLKFGTTIIQCPVPALLQSFCREDGTIVWRAALSQHGCEGERWYEICNNRLSLTSRPKNLQAQCELAYVAPTCVEDALKNKYTRFTVIVPGSGMALGVIFIEQTTGLFSSISSDEVSVCQVDTEICENNTVAMLVKVTDEPPQLLRWQYVHDCSTNTTLIQEVWWNECNQVRSYRYFTPGSETEIDSVTIISTNLVSCETCSPSCVL